MSILFVQLITIYRAIAVFAFILYNQKFSSNINCLILITAFITDFIDGYLARKFNITTNGGMLLDLFSDKYLTIMLSVFLLTNGYPRLPIIVIITREIFLLSFRSMLHNGEFIIRTNRYLGAITVVPFWIITLISLYFKHTVIHIIIWIIGTIASINLTYKIMSNWTRIKMLFLSTK